jgi:hypothetical protein
MCANIRLRAIFNILVHAATPIRSRPWPQSFQANPATRTASSASPRASPLSRPARSGRGTPSRPTRPAPRCARCWIAAKRAEHCEPCTGMLHPHIEDDRGRPLPRYQLRRPGPAPPRSDAIPFRRQEVVHQALRHIVVVRHDDEGRIRRGLNLGMWLHRYRFQERKEGGSHPGLPDAARFIPCKEGGTRTEENGERRRGRIATGEGKGEGAGEGRGREEIRSWEPHDSCQRFLLRYFYAISKLTHPLEAGGHPGCALRMGPRQISSWRALPKGGPLDALRRDGRLVPLVARRPHPARRCHRPRRGGERPSPVPSDLLMLLAGVEVAQHRLHLWAVLLVMALATLAGPSCLFAAAYVSTVRRDAGDGTYASRSSKPRAG